MIRGVITKIHNIKRARGRGIKNYGSTFIRITFKMEDGSWAKTDICPEYRNYIKWKGIIKAGVGTVVKGLQFRRGKEINADSPVVICPDVKLFEDKIKEQVIKDKEEETGQQNMFNEKQEQSELDLGNTNRYKYPD